MEGLLSGGYCGLYVGMGGCVDVGERLRGGGVDGAENFAGGGGLDLAAVVELTWGVEGSCHCLGGS